MITVTGLTKRYGDRTVVDGVSFTVRPGTVTGFLGPNGAGKTTTMRMVTGLVPASAGEALVDGRRYVDLPNPAAVMGTLLDAGAVHPGRTTCASWPTPSACRPGGWTRCSSWSTSARTAGAGSAPTRSACGSGSASPARCSPTRRC
jgi:energy-coupling factor transporter ATP-binding protein EcfA2